MHVCDARLPLCNAHFDAVVMCILLHLLNARFSSSRERDFREQEDQDQKSTAIEKALERYQKLLSPGILKRY